MGCWNETDLITQLPIHYGDKVRLFIIAKDQFRGDMAEARHASSYATEVWRPYALPIVGTYNDYGSIENVQENGITDTLLKHLSVNLIPVPDRTSNTFENSNLDWTTVLEYLTDEGLYAFYVPDENGIQMDNVLGEFKKIDALKSREHVRLKKELLYGNSSYTQLYAVLVLEEVYQTVISNDEDNMFGNNFRVKMQEFSLSYLKDVRKVAEAELELDAMQDTEDKDGLRMLSFNLWKMQREMIEMNDFSHCLNFVDGSMGTGNFLRKYTGFIKDLMMSGVADDDPRIINLINDMIDFVIFCRSMHDLRKMWQPQSGKGSQSDGGELHAKLAHVVLGIVKARDDEFNDDAEEEDITEP